MISYLFEMEDPAVDIMTAVVIGAVAKLVGLVVVGRTQRKKFERVGTVANLYIYPVKSCGAMEEQKAYCTSVGLHADGIVDRHWMFLDERDRQIHMKLEPRLTLVKAKNAGDSIRLTAPGMPDLDLPKKPDLKKARIETKVLEEQHIRVVYCGKQADEWISKFINRPARLVFSCPELGTRDVFIRSRDWDNTARPGDVTVFAYLTSYLVTTTASLKHVNSQIATPASMVNFRPNIVIDNDVPFDEDNWKEIRIGDHTLFHSVEPCRRCMITTINPETAKFSEDKQPLELLRSFRCREPYGKSPIFGMYVSNDLPGFVKIGDPVYVMRDSTSAS